MLSLSNFATHPKCNNTCLSHNPISKPYLFYHQNVNFLNYSSVSGKFPSGFCSYASKDIGKRVQDVLDIEEVDKDFDFFDEVDDGNGIDYEDDEEEEVIIPLRNMKKWLKNKPRGFGEGKVYDTSLEDKLMEEIEQSRKAQLANVNELKNNPGKAISSKFNFEKSKDVQEGYRVRLVNLPKKKNIHKDLRLAFEGVPGMIDIVPAVYGNKKTRDPVCKGFAFVVFKSEDEASRFVQKFSGQGIAFGKVQKQIRCELLNSNPGKSDQLVEETNAAPQLHPQCVDGNPGTSYDVATFEIRGLAESNIGDAEEGGDETVTSADEDPLSAEMDTDDSQVPREAFADVSPSTKQQKKTSKIKEEAASKRKKEKSPKLNIPGSANRLKIKEKAMLADVFSKYTINTASAEK